MDLQTQGTSLREVITAHGDLVEGATSMTKDILWNFAGDIRDHETLRTAALNRRAEHDRLVRLGEEPTGVSTEFQRVTDNYTVLTRVDIPVYDYTTTAPSADWIVDADGNATRAPFISSREQVGTRFEIQDVEHTGVRADRVGRRPPVNQCAYNNMDWYQNRVDAHPDRYSPPGARIWDLRARMVDVTDAVRGGTGASAANRALRIAGPVAMVAGAGLTYHGEYRTPLQEVAHENPSMSHDELESRAREMAAVQGTTHVGLDIAAGATGAMIGTAVGGPLGTVVGFGVGIGVSWLLEESGAADVVKDVAQDAWDGLGEGVGNAWDSIVG